MHVIEDHCNLVAHAADIFVPIYFTDNTIIVKNVKVEPCMSAHDSNFILHHYSYTPAACIKSIIIIIHVAIDSEGRVSHLHVHIILLWL